MRGGVARQAASTGAATEVVAQIQRQSHHQPLVPPLASPEVSIATVALVDAVMEHAERIFGTTTVSMIRMAASTPTFSQILTVLVVLLDLPLCCLRLYS